MPPCDATLSPCSRLVSVSDQDAADTISAYETFGTYPIVHEGNNHQIGGDAIDDDGPLIPELVTDEEYTSDEDEDEGVEFVKNVDATNEDIDAVSTTSSGSGRLSIAINDECIYCKSTICTIMCKTCLRFYCFQCEFCQWETNVCFPDFCLSCAEENE